MIVVVLFKVIASTYLQCATKLFKKIIFFVKDVCKKRPWYVCICT